MSDAVRQETEALLARFTALGARRIEADILQPAEVLLDLYGEDIRARAYVTQDQLRGEQMLRPDFTVPVVQMHMAEHAEPARYTYAGPVFRRQEEDAGRPSEYPQVGYEVFDRGPADKVEAEIYAAFHAALSGLPVRAIIGDMAILRAAVLALDTTEHRKAALLRHLWRPNRFRALLDRFSVPLELPESVIGGPEIGLRSAADVAERLILREADAQAPRLAPDDRAALEALLDVKVSAGDAVETLRALGVPGTEAPIKALDARLAAFEAAGIDLSAMQFEVSYGRTSMEYYDGFVFGFEVEGLPPVATGGRYDALTLVLGEGSHVPAVGGVVRPDLVAQLKGASC